MFSIEIKQVTGHARDVEVLMRSTVSTCPRVGARCYPPLLGITRRSCLEATAPRHGVLRAGLTLAWPWRAHLFSLSAPLLCQQQQHPSPRPGPIVEVGLAP